MELSELGEEGLLNHIRRTVAHKTGDVVVGIGDDACALRSYSGLLTLLTTDAFTEGNHFDLAYFSHRDVGIKAVAASLSDVAAMGGIPRYCLVCLLAPGSISSDDAESVISGIVDCCEKYGVELIGGDVVGSPQFSVCVAIIGEVEPEKIVLRSGARPGDSLYVTGDLGASEAGRCVLSDGMSLPIEVREYVSRRHRTPTPRIEEARELVERHSIRSMIDLSDGLSPDAGHIAAESGVKLLIESDRIPISSFVKAVGKAASISALEMALHGGEDFELLFTAIEPVLKETAGTPITRIGRVVEGSGVSLVSSDGSETPLKPQGYKHF